MNAFIRFRDDIRRFVLSKEMLFIKLWSAFIALVGLFCISANFGHNKQISQVWDSIIISLICAFFPIQGVALVLAIVLRLIDLNSIIRIIKNDK